MEGKNIKLHKIKNEKKTMGPSLNDVRSLGGGGVSENLTLLNKISKFYTIKV